MATSKEIPRISLTAWQKEGKELFGKDTKDWMFQCSGCGNIQSTRLAVKQLRKMKISGLKGVDLEGYFHATIFCKCVGCVFLAAELTNENSKAFGCHTDVSEDNVKAGRVVVHKGKGEAKLEMFIFDFAREGADGNK